MSADPAHVPSGQPPRSDAGGSPVADAALIETLETGAGALLALAALRARVQRMGGPDGVEQALGEAIVLVRGALEDLSRHAAQERPHRLALGFVRGCGRLP